MIQQSIAGLADMRCCTSKAMETNHGPGSTSNSGPRLLEIETHVSGGNLITGLVKNEGTSRGKHGIPHEISGVELEGIWHV